MGQASSSASLPCADPRIPHLALTFQSPDKLTLALADKSTIELTRQAIRESIPAEESGRHDTFVHFEGRTDMNGYEFKFRDYPFMRSCGDSVFIRSMRMCCFMLEIYGEHGWTLDLASDLSRGKEMTTWFFRRFAYDSETSNGYEAEGNIRRKNILCISITTGDTIQLINAPEHMRRLLARAVRDGYAAEAIKGESLTYDGDYEIQLASQAWLAPDPITALRVRRLILEIVRLFESVGGYQFYGSVNTKGTYDSLFFIQADEDDGQFETDRSYFVVSLNSGCCVTLVDSPSSDVVEAVLRAIVRYWPGKLHSQTVLDDRGTHEFRLKGNPWYSTGGTEATAARLFICGLLETLHIDGYDALTALDVTRGLNDKAAFIFRSRHAASMVRSPQQKAAFLLKGSSQPYWCISLQDDCKLRLINAPKNLRMAVRHVIVQLWPWGIHRENTFFNNEGYVFKLGAGPWGAEQHQYVAAMMSYILKVLNDRGCRAVLSADITGRYIANNHGGSHSLDVHSWFLTCDAPPMQHKTETAPVIRQTDENRCSTLAEEDEDEAEDEDDLGPLTSAQRVKEFEPDQGSDRKSQDNRKERPLRRKISAVEYTSYVVNADNSAQASEDASAEDENTMEALKQEKLPLKPVEAPRRKPVEAPRRKIVSIGHAGRSYSVMDK